jgi:D-amino-acid dehydrogenase
MTRAKHVVICGAGVVGLSCAYYLLERGHRVTVLERGGPDHDSCSLGNAGYISPSHIVPLASPGIVARAIRWMGDPESPFWVRPRLDPALIAWGIRFWRASRPARARAAEPILGALNMQSRALYEALAEACGNEFALTREGLLMLFRDPRGLEEEASVAERARSLGIPAEVMDARGVAALEPEVRLDVAGGVFYPMDAHLTPQRLVAALTRRVADRGASLVFDAEVTGWRVEGRSIRAAVWSRGEAPGDEFVLAAGSWSSQAARPLRLALPLQPGKGYSVTLPAPRERPRRSILLQEARVAITPMDGSLRVGGTMELAGLDLAIRPARVRGILKSLTRYLPSFRVEDFASCAPWCGLRPCTPDGLPYVGRFGRFDNLIAATGHAMMGVSMGPITGTLVAQVVSGEPPAIDLAPLSPDRFARAPSGAGPPP